MLKNSTPWVWLEWIEFFSFFQHFSAFWKLMNAHFSKNSCYSRYSIINEWPQWVRTPRRELSAAVVRPANSLIFHCASWASNFFAWSCRRHPTFLLKRRSSCSNKHSVAWSFLFEASPLSTCCGRKSSSPVSTSEIEFTSCRSRRGKTMIMSEILSVHKEW